MKPLLPVVVAYVTYCGPPAPQFKTLLLDLAAEKIVYEIKKNEKNNTNFFIIKSPNKMNTRNHILNN